MPPTAALNAAPLQTLRGAKGNAAAVNPADKNPDLKLPPLISLNAPPITALIAIPPPKERNPCPNPVRNAFGLPVRTTFAAPLLIPAIAA